MGLVAKTEPKALPGNLIETTLENDKKSLKLDTALSRTAPLLKAKGLFYMIKQQESDWALPDDSKS